MHLYAITGGSMSIDSNDIEAIAKYWDERSQYFDEEHNTEDLSLWSQELMKLLKEDNGDVKKILDIGTGTGFLALLLAGNGYDVTGVDISKEMMELGKKKAVDCGNRNSGRYLLQSGASIHMGIIIIASCFGNREWGTLQYTGYSSNTYRST